MNVLRDLTLSFSRSKKQSDAEKTKSEPAQEPKQEPKVEPKPERQSSLKVDPELILPEIDAGLSSSPHLGGVNADVQSPAPAPDHHPLAEEIPMIVPPEAGSTKAAQPTAAAAEPIQATPEASAPAGDDAKSVQPAPADADSAPAKDAPASAPKRSLGRSGKKKNTADKDLQRLRRVDLLELLVDQINENDSLVTENAQLFDLSERLKAKLDQKDAQIEHLKQRLNAKDDQIRHLEERNRSLAHAAGTIDVSELVAIEEIAIDRYLKQLQSRGDIPASNSGH